MCSSDLGFLPSVYQGVQCRSQGDPVLYVSDPPGMDRSMRRKSLDALRELNELQARELGSAETLTRIAQYELAYRMQTSVPEVMDIAREPAHVLEAYGAQPGQSSLANNCLLARRLVERGVRFVQLYHRGWDHHGGPDGNLVFDLKKRCLETDQPAVALIRDLKERGLLDSTLVVWGGEFGRKSTRDRNGYEVPGRDHNARAFSVVLAGGGIKGGTVHGATDEFGSAAVQDKVHPHDLHATILHCMGLNHERLTYRFNGRDFRLTDVAGNVVKPILA